MKIKKISQNIPNNENKNVEIKNYTVRSMFNDLKRLETLLKEIK